MNKPSESIQRHLSDEDADVVSEALRALTRLGVTTANSQIINLLSDERWEVRAQAARSCGALEIRRAIPVLKLLKFDSFWWVRKRAIESLDILDRLDVDDLTTEEGVSTPASSEDTANNIYYLGTRNA